MKRSKLGMALALGALIGGVATFFLSPKSGKENREMTKEKIDEWRKRFENKSPQEIAVEIFGQATDEGKKLYEKSQKLLNSKLDELKLKVDEIDQDKYREVVQEVMLALQKEKEASGERVLKLKKYLLDRWDYVMSESAKDIKRLASKEEVEK